jgi:hypothetical protein
MTIDTLTFTTNAFNGTATTYTLDLTVIPDATTAGVEDVTGVTFAGATANIEVKGYNGSSEQVSELSDPASIDVSFTVNGTTYEFFTKGLGFAMVSGPQGNLSAYSVTNVAFVCFAEGTRILTERGQVDVEALRVGDLALTAGGALRPVKWIGHRRVDGVGHPRAADALPVRISAHAFGLNRPQRDLYVSPGHALCVDVLGEVLIRAESLVNGATIQQVEVDSVTYWHVELDSHDILLAENLACESYLDMNNRSFFVESGVVGLIDVPDVRAEAEYCRPLHEGGPVVEAVRAQLQLRALALGWTLGREPFNDLHLIVDGLRVDPSRDGLSATFEVPAGARDIRMVSLTSKPCHLPGDNRDARSLGVCVRRLSVGDAEIALDDSRLEQGFHHLETQSWGAFRWTNGSSVLPASLFDESRRRLRLEMLLPPLPFWVAPAATSRAAVAA